jgi:hypothetical protein
MPPIITPALNSAGTLEPGFMTTSGARSLDETHRLERAKEIEPLMTSLEGLRRQCLDLPGSRSAALWRVRECP